jgi:hypothetical protein
MKMSAFPFKKTTLAAVVVVALGGCFHDESDSTDNRNVGATQTTETVKNYYAVVDGEGYVNLYKDFDETAGGTTTRKTAAIGSFKVASGVTLGEIHFHHGRAFVVIQGGLKENGVDIGGGIAIVDMKAAIANPGADITTFVKIVSLKATMGVGVSRIVHTYADPDGEHLWLNNDGPRGDAGNDSVFIVNWHHPDATTLAAYAAEVQDSVEEIEVGDGHKKSAFSHGTINSTPVPLRFATHNLSDQSVTIIDNSNSMARAVIDTVCLNPLADEDPNDPASPDVCPKDLGNTAEQNALDAVRRKNSPHGMDYSMHSGKFYTGITSGSDVALAIIDATAAAPFTLQKLMAGPITVDPNAPAIPAAGYTHASHDGEYVYTSGYKSGKGYFSIVKAEHDADDTVHQVIDLGNLTSSSFDISHMEHDHNGMVEHHVNILVPSGFRSVGQLNSKIALIEINHDTGKLSGCEAGFCETSRISYIDVGATRGEHRNGEITADGARAVYPNADCQGNYTGTDTNLAGIINAPDTTDCKTINVIDVMTRTVAKLPTAGRNPGSVGIMSASEISGTPSDGGDDHGHTH